MVNFFLYYKRTIVDLCDSVTEMLGPSKRRWASILIMYFFTFGYIMLAGLAYLIRNWQYLEIACSAPAVLFVTYWL